MASLAPSAAARVRAISGWSSSGRRSLASVCSQPMQQQRRPQPLPALSSSHPTQPRTRPRADVPAVAAAPMHQRACFSTSPVLEKRRRRYHPRDNNRLRGVSSLYGSGPREFLSVSDSPMPVPTVTTVGSDAKREAAAAAMPEIDPDHGLWQFFYDRQPAQPPTKDAAFGRAWTVEELRRKSWDDLHKLWWVCIKERNRVATAAAARKHFDLGYGDYESSDRDLAVRRTMRGIKHVLTERFYVWEDAVELAQADPEIDLSGSGPAFQPSAFLEEEPALPEAEGGDATAAPPAAAAGEKQAIPVR